MVWTQQDIIDELGNSSQLLKKKKDSSDDRTYDIEKTLVRGIVSKFAFIQVDAAVAMKLHDAVEAASGFGESSIAQLKKAIDDCLTQIPLTAPSSVTRPQWINCCKYLTKADWQSLSSETYHTQVTIITKRLRLLGVQSMAEQSIKFATACLLTTYKQPPNSDVIFGIVQDMKLSFASSSINTVGLPAVLKYPEDPNSLDPVLLAHAYQHGEVPAMVDKPELPMLCKIIPLRKTNKHITSTSKDAGQQQPASNRTVQQQPSSSSNGVGGASDCDPFMSMANGMMQFMNMNMMNMMKHMNGQQVGQQQVNLKMSPPKPVKQQQAIAVTAEVTQAEATKFEPKVRAPALALTDAEEKPVLPQQPVLPEQNSQQEDSQDSHEKDQTSVPPKQSAAAIEEAAFAALKARNENKKVKDETQQDLGKDASKKNATAKAKAKGQAKAKAVAKAGAKAGAKGGAKGKPGVKKRPAASTTQVPNKHSKLALVDYEPGLPDSALWSGRTKESWMSKHYHAARGKASAAGYSESEAKEIARLAHARAKCTWDEVFSA